MAADPRGRVVYANDACRRVLGRGPEHLVGMDLVDLVPSRLRPPHLAAFRRFVETGDGRLIGQTVRVPVLLASGDEIPIEMVLSTTTRDDELRIIATIRSADAPAEVDPSARVSEALLVALSGGTSGGELAARLLGPIARAGVWDVAALWVLDRGSDHLRCQTMWCDDAIDATRFEATTMATLFPPGVGLPGRVWESGRAAWIEELSLDPNFPRARAAEAIGLHSGLAFPLTTADRFVGVIECFSRAARPTDVAVLASMTGVGALVATFLDRGEAEVERGRLLDQIQNERARLDAVLRQLPLGVVISDAQGEVLLSNEAVDRLASDPRSLVRDARPVAIDDEIEIVTPGGAAATVSVSAVPVLDRAGNVVSTVTTIIDVTERRAQSVRLKLLADAGEILAGSLDIDETLAAVARVSVDRLADHCVVDVLEPSGRIRRVASAVADPAKEAAARRLDLEYPLERGAEAGIALVLRTGEPLLYDEITEAQLLAAARDDAHRQLLLELAPVSTIIVPLVGRGRTLGALTYTSFTPGRQFSDAEVELARELGRRAGLAVANAQLYTRARDVAEALQASLLPPRLPRIEGLDLGARYLAGGEGLIVGGDFYDVFRLEDGRWAIAIGDVCGIGAEAAALTARVRYTARAAPERTHPAGLLRRVNEVLRSEASADARFCTMIYGVVEKRRQGMAVIVASAGHPQPFVVTRDASVSRVEAGGPLLGVFDAVQYDETEVELKPGDALVLYTDGVVEARGPKGLLGEDGLLRILASSSDHPAAEIASAIGGVVLAQSAGSASDDAAILVLKATERA